MCNLLNKGLQNLSAGSQLLLHPGSLRTLDDKTFSENFQKGGRTHVGRGEAFQPWGYSSLSEAKVDYLVHMEPILGQDCQATHKDVGGNKLFLFQANELAAKAN